MGHDSRGITLVEVLITLAVAGILLSAAFSLQIFGVRSFTKGVGRATVQQETRILETIIERELRNAGYVGTHDDNPKAIHLQGNTLYYGPVEAPVPLQMFEEDQGHVQISFVSFDHDSNFLEYEIILQMGGIEYSIENCLLLNNAVIDNSGSDILNLHEESILYYDPDPLAMMDTGNEDDTGEEQEGWPDVDGYIYHEGLYEDMWAEGYAQGVGTQTKWGNHLDLHADDGWDRCEVTYVTAQSVDLTAIKEIRIDWENMGDHRDHNKSFLVVSKDPAGSHAEFDLRISASGNFFRRMDTLDVEALTGSYYIRVHALDDHHNQERESIIKVYSIALISQ